MNLDTIIQKRIDDQIEKIFRSTFCKDICTSTSTSSTYTEASLTKEKLDNLIEQLRPEHAILLNNYVPIGEIFEIDNCLPDKYYCKKLLMINTLYYKNKLDDIFKQYGVNIKVYEI